MATDLLTIAKSGARAARIALDLTAQNIANAGTQGYVRRTVSLAEVVASGGIGATAGDSLAGVQVDRIVRNADLFRQAEVRRTGADAARAGAEVAGLEAIEAALEQSGLYPALVRFEAALDTLAGDPVDPALRTAALAEARTVAKTFNLAAGALEAAGEGLRFAATDGVAQVNLLASELGKVNLRLARAVDASADQTALLDQRDELLRRLSGFAGISTSVAANHTVEVRLGGSGGPLLLSGATAAPLGLTSAADGTVVFSLAGAPVSLGGGSLAGQAQALSALAENRTRLDALADALIAAANSAQASGVALDGTPGQPLFAGSGAGGIALALGDSASLATAPAGAAAGSRDPANLSALRSALASAGIVEGADKLLTAASNGLAARMVTRDVLATIAESAAAALADQAGVDLDAEAVNLMRFQQAFQASGRAMQVAATLFDTLLEIR